MQRIMIVAFALLLAGCAALRGPSGPDLYPVFFVPRTSDLTPEGQQIVRQAAANAQRRKVAKIEIAIPPDVPGGAPLVEGRYTAIQNIISAAGVDPKLYARAPVAMAANIPGATDRAEIRLVP